MHLCKLKTDYMDFGFIHCIDQQAELDKALQGGILEMVQKYKQQGKVWHIGFSSHNPAMVHKVLDIHIVDMVMFSINPAYDYTDKEEYGIGTAGERMALYRRCEQEGVGISVMKPSSVTNFFGKKLKIAMRTRIHTKRDESSAFCARYRSLLCFFHTHLFRQGTAVHTGKPPARRRGFSSSIR